jgi:O-methyltransferase involved in polyketide biosynthesis
MAGQQTYLRGFDPSRPAPARVCNYLLGGKDHYAADRELGDRLVELQPRIRIAARENRRFVGRAIRHLVQRGIRQFLDIGTGLPCSHNVHEMASRYAPGVKTVYIDNDPAVLVHGRALLARSDRVDVVAADLRNPAEIFGAPGVKQHIDFGAPVAVLLTAVLHFVTDDDDPRGIVAELCAALTPGSAVVISHATADTDPDAGLTAARIYSESSTCPLVPRSRPEIARLFDGLEMADPGLVYTTQWRPEGPALPPSLALAYAGIGLRRASL